jgi:hypothetical protein
MNLSNDIMDDVVECLIENVAGLTWSANALRGTIVGKQQVERRRSQLTNFAMVPEGGELP